MDEIFLVHFRANKSQTQVKIETVRVKSAPYFDFHDQRDLRAHVDFHKIILTVLILRAERATGKFLARTKEINF